MSGPPSAVTQKLGHEIVRAGAGAGKTTTLVRRVIDLIEHYRGVNSEWPKLVVTTFTRKATQELRERLTVEACERDSLELLDYCRSRTLLHISTIHGVLGLFLRRYGHLMGVDPSFTFLTDTGARQLRRQALRQVLMMDRKGSTLLEVFPLAKLESLLSQYSEASVLYPAMRPATAIEIIEQQRTHLQLEGRQADELGSQILELAQGDQWREYGGFLKKLSAALKTASDEGGWEVLMNVVEDWPTKPRMSKKEPEISEEMDSWVRDINDRIGKMVDDPSWSPATAEKFAELAELFEPLAKKYDERLIEIKLRQSSIEMSDLEILSARLIRRHPEVAGIFSEDWDHWLVDEFQDTSPLQIELLKRLMGERPHFVVGDPQQSIYLFRGARVEIFSKHEAELKERGVEPQFRLKNYRSRPSLLVFLNDFFLRLSPEFQAMTPKSEDFEPDTVVGSFHGAPEPDKLTGRAMEYEAIRAHIQGLLWEKNAELSDICILARKNDHLLAVAQHLRQKGIPTHVHATRGYFGRREIRDALAILKFLVHPHDNKNVIQLLRSPWARVPDDILVKCLKNGGAGFWTQIKNCELIDHPVIQDLERLRAETGSNGFARTWERALVQLGLFDFSSHHDATGRREANLWKLLSAFAQAERQPGFKVLDFIAQSQSVLVDTESADEGDAVTAVEPNVINLMTIHAAKGLQRRHVILPYCDERPSVKKQMDFAATEEEGIWSLVVQSEDSDKWSYSPHAKKLADLRHQRELKEHDRLLYVALTRAQESLFISWSGVGKPESWVARWNWPVTDSGIIKRDRYSYKVTHGEVIVESDHAQVKSAHKVRQSWGTGEALAGRHSGTDGLMYSVVDLLEAEMSKDGPGAFVQPNIVGGVQRAVFGTQVHRLLELLHVNPKAAWRELALSWFGERAQEVIKGVEWVQALKEPPMKKLFGSAFAEWGFQVKTASGILEGQIDLWGELEGKIWLVDYKSGDPRYAEKAFAQLDVYAYALRRFGHDRPIQLAVIYPFEMEVKQRAARTNVEIVERFPQLKLP